MKKKSSKITVAGVTFEASDVISVILKVNDKIIQISEMGPVPGAPGAVMGDNSKKSEPKAIGFGTF